MKKDIRISCLCSVKLRKIELETKMKLKVMKNLDKETKINMPMSKFLKAKSRMRVYQCKNSQKAVFL